jgi:hypothetical protein
MSLIHTAELNGVDPFAYLVALQRHHEDVAESPDDWMPWNYKATVASLADGPSLTAPRAPDQRARCAGRRAEEIVLYTRLPKGHAP